MKETTRIIINYRLDRARESLADARKLFKSDSLYAAVNRIYYGMFYSVNALLLTENLSSPKHSGVRALFNKEFVHKGKVSMDFGRFYSRILEKRQSGDYKDLVEFKKQDVQLWLEKAEEFVKAMEKLVLEIIQ